MDFKETLLQNTTFVSGEGLEFLLALLNIAALERLTASKNAAETHPDEAIHAILTDMEGRMSDFLRVEMCHFFGNVNGALPIFSFALESFSFSVTPLELIEGLKKQPALSFLQQAKTIWKQLTDEGGSDEAHGPWSAADRYAEESKHRLVYLLEAFYRDIYIRYEPQVHPYIRKTAEHMRDVFRSDPPAFYSSYLSITPEAFSGKACIHVSAFLQSSLFILQPVKPGAPTWIALGGNREAEQEAIVSETRQVALKFFKLMSDKSRYEIVQLLLQRPWYNEELAKHMGISPATVNHHLAAMLEMEIVTMVREQHRMYYSLEYEKLSRLLHRVLKGMLGERGGKAKERVI